jgi:hypothetical protein
MTSEQQALTPEERIREAYTELAARPGDDWISLVSLREQLADVPRDVLDEALQELAVQPGCHVIAEDNQQALTAADHEAAVRFGGSTRHMLMIEKKGRRR